MNQAIDFFKQLPSNVSRDICRHAELVTLPAGRLLFRQGDFGSTFYIILYGSVLLWADVAESQCDLSDVELRAAAARTSEEEEEEEVVVVVGLTARLAAPQTPTPRRCWSTSGGTQFAGWVGSIGMSASNAAGRSFWTR